MQILEFIFHFGVIIAVFTFLWWFLGLLLSLIFAPFGLTPGKIYYAQKTLKYFFLVTVAFRFALEARIARNASLAFRFAHDDRFGLQGLKSNIPFKEPSIPLEIDEAFISALILLAYLIGKTEAKNNRVKFYANFGNMRQMQVTPFDRNKELLLIGFAIAVYAYFVFFPDGSHNVITNWLVDSIVSISETPVFGWIFKIIGFFFLIMVIMRFVNGFFALLGLTSRQNNTPSQRNNDDFDDYEEVK